jgi:uncharacterized OB-fold protein
MLLGRDGGIAEIVVGPARAEEARERWRPAGEAAEHEGDPTVISASLAPGVGAVLGAGEAAAVVSSASPRAAARVERSLGGPGDAVLPRAGLLGAAHPLARLVAALEREQTLVVAANGLTEVLRSRPRDGAAPVAERARTALAAGVAAERPAPDRPVEGFAPYQSLARASRERGQDLRLEARRCRDCGRVLYPPPAGPCPSCGASGPHEGARLGRQGAVLTLTRDHVYPDGELTGMAVVEMDGGGRFYGQVVAGATVGVGERVRVVPRVLHRGGGVVQYFWKVEPCR